VKTLYAACLAPSVVLTIGVWDMGRDWWTPRFSIRDHGAESIAFQGGHTITGAALDDALPSLISVANHWARMVLR
jgi:hypothetical protein